MRATEVTPRAKRPKNRKAQIAMAAAELFCERGYHPVGVDEVAAAVGISGPAVYRHFPTKYALLVHATRELIAGALAATGSGVGVSPEARLDAILAGLARFGVEQRRVAALYQWENRYLTPEHRAEFRAGLATVLGRVVEPLREVRPDLGVPAAELLARAALSTFGSLSTHRAAVARGRGEPVLRRLGWAMLRADIDGAVRPPSPSPGAAAERGAVERGAGVPAAEPGLAVAASPESVAAPSSGAVPATSPAPAVAVGIGVRPAARREMLLVEAIRLFRRLGYHAVSMDDIGAAIGINASSVYRYFPGKADLLAAAYYRASERLAAMTESALSGPVDAPDAPGVLRRLVEAYVAFSFEQSDLVSVYVSENNNLSEPDRHQLRKTQRLHVEEWVRLLVAARPGLPAAEARILVHAALNLVTDLGRAARFVRGAQTEERIATLAGIALNA